MSILEHKPNLFERMAIALEKQNELIESQNLILGEIAYQLKNGTKTDLAETDTKGII